ncbi:Peptidyl-prolyl cis-trans isomerase fkbp14 [Goodea atripinnis]|uniref:peptidylprolyl isomerase n=1 Tax=Goodea atripinnis TaxID=208336 RepID=A0ABV0PZN3_9TELE
MLASASRGKLAEADVTIEVLHRPFICHRKSKYGDMLLVHHDGYFENGTMFYSREVIKGWDLGLQDMCSGEKRKLVIPPVLAYGEEGKGKIPPESTLTFLVELLEIRNGPRSYESFQEMDLNDDWRLSKYEVKEYLKKEYARYGYPPNDTLHENMAADIFAKEDKNKDGFISSREFTYKRDEL